MSTSTGTSPGESASNSNMPSVACKQPMPPPSASTFSFKAPFPPVTGPNALLKQRRVSLALPSSPRVVPDSAWNFRDDTGIDAHRTGHTTAGQGYDTDTDALLPEKRGKMRRIASDDDEFGFGSGLGAEGAGLGGEKKQRKKWTTEETQMLVDGCNKHGVGNWKTILSDKSLKFDNRSPVDLKDRFRTYFPDAYRLHYPNAKTHLSSKIKRSTLPDGKPLFEKTRSKKRRPFTEQEDKALREGYEKHGTVWAAIVKDPVFQEQGRRSTDLRDRFRNAFPDLYQAAGYKPRAATTKKKDGALASSSTLSGHTGAEMSLDDAVADANASTITAHNTWRRPAIPLPMRAATDDQIPEAGPIRRRRRAMLRGGTKSVPQSAAVSEDEDDGSVIGEEDMDVFKPPARRAKRPTFSAGSDNTPAEKRRARASSASAALTLASTSVEVDMELSVESSPAASAKNPSTQSSSQTRSSQGTSTSPSDLDLDDSRSLSHSHSGLDTPVHAHATWSPTSSHLSSDLLSQTHTPAIDQSSPFSRRMDTATQVDGNNMIGKSPWGTQDWLFSANPRLDPSSSMSGYNGANNSNTSNTSVTDLDVDGDGDFSPASPFSFNHLNHGVMDRYDLFPTTTTSLHAHNLSHSISHASSPNHFGHQHSSLHNLGLHSLYHNSMDERQDDFASVCSEIGFGDRDTHSTFSDDMAGYTHTGFRGFTHHSNYAGDLIFGARTHQPQQPYYGMGSSLGLGLGLGASVGVGNGFGMNNNSGLDMATEGIGGMGLGLDLDGMAPPTTPATAIHPLQLHGSALAGIDEIELTSITLDDRTIPEKPDQTMEDAATKDSVQPASAGSSVTGGPRYDLTSIDDLIDLSQHDDPSLNTTPPGTPLMSSRPSSMYQRALNSGFGSLHGRSISVPPSEARSLSRPDAGQAHAHSEQEITALRSVPFFSSLSQHDPKRTPAPPVASLNPARPPPSSFAPNFAFGLPSTIASSTLSNVQDHSVPYLDLHYKTSSNPSGMSDAMDTSTGFKFAADGVYRQGQALDLAQSAATSAALKTLGIPASLRKHIPTMPPPKSTVSPITPTPGSGMLSRSHSLHHRGQSTSNVVSPQDLLLRKTSDNNKRKRSSWDGGAF